MKAVRIHEYGGPEVLRYEEAPEPKPGPFELLVRVQAAGLNRADLALRQGQYLSQARFPQILGFEVAGEVVALGSRVPTEGAGSFAVGQRVCGTAGGGYAELACVGTATALPVPEGVSAEEAAGIPVVFLTAWQSLTELARLAAGEWALIHSAGSGVGIAGIQLARMLGARVITTASSDEKLARAAELGAEHAINYRTRDFAEEVRAITGGKGVGVILDGVGGATFAGNVAALAPFGRLVLLGAVGGAELTTGVGPLLKKNAAIYGYWLSGMGRDRLTAATAALREQVLPRFADGTLRSLVARSFPLSEAAAAHAFLDSREAFGKVVLVP